MGKNSFRPKIPEQVKCELWGRAAGRCEFQGCNDSLYKDDLTQQRANLAVISHIVSYSPDGPRGDPVRSAQLATDISNLMLTCRKHGDLIDKKELESEYPERLLLIFKHDHEQRIRRLTEIKEDPQTHILILQAPIDGRPTRINPTDAVRAVLPKYPVEEHPWLIDPGGIGLPADSIGFFPMLAESITSQTRELLARRAGGTSITCLSVFALAPVPLLVHFGHLLGDMEQVDLYQRHRDTQDWTWKEEEATDVFYEVLKPDAPSSGLSEVALLLSVSETVNQNRVAKTLGCEPQFYEIRARDPNRDFLRSRKRLELFEYEVRKLLFELRDSHAHECAIHLFAAVPAPMAIAFGRCIKDFDAPFQLYEYRKNDRSFISALTINSRQRRRHD